MGKLKSFSFLKRPKVIIPAAVVALLAAAVVLAVHNMTAPAIGSINQTPPSQAEQVVPHSQPGVYRGKYISFSYPAHYKTVPSKLTGNYLEAVDYHSTDNSVKQINVGVSPGDVNTDSGVTYRRQHKELYRENDSRLGVEFTRLDGTEDTFFIAHNGLLATVSLTAPYSDDSHDAFYVASSLKWL